MNSENNTSMYYEQGSSRFAETDEIMESTTKIDLMGECECGGIPLYSDGRIIWTDGKDTNSICISTPGGGKSRRECTPILFSDIMAGYSVIVTDPKGEHLKSSYELLKREGYTIKWINFRDPQNSHRWNPLYRGAKLYKQGKKDLASEAFHEVAHSIYSEVHSERDPFWETMAENVFVGYAMIACEYEKPEDTTLSAVYMLFLDGEHTVGNTTVIRTYLEDYCNEDGIKQALFGYVFAPNDTRMSIASVFSSTLSKIVVNESINTMLSGKTFLAEDIVRNKTAIFACLKDESSTYHSMVSLLVHEMYVSLIEYAEKTGGKLNRTVDFILDEFGNFPRIIDIDNKLSACRSRNIRFMLFIQSLAQLDSRYGQEESQTILNCCDNWILQQSREMKILQQFSDRCGDVYGKYSGEKRPLIAASSLQHLSKRDGEVLTLLGGEYPFISALPDRSVYMEKLGLRELATIPKTHVRRASNRKRFSLSKYVKDIRERKIKEMLSFPGIIDCKSQMRTSNETFSVDEMVKRIDAKVAELDGKKQEMKEQSD